MQVDDPDAGPFELEGHEGEVTCVDWCRQDMAHLASVADDATMRVWQINRPFPYMPPRRLPRKVLHPHTPQLQLPAIGQPCPVTSSQWFWCLNWPRALYTMCAHDATMQVFQITWSLVFGPSLLLRMFPILTVLAHLDDERRF